MIMTNDYDGHSLLVAVLVEETCIYAGRGCEMTLLPRVNWRLFPALNLPSVVSPPTMLVILILR